MGVRVCECVWGHIVQDHTDAEACRQNCTKCLETCMHAKGTHVNEKHTLHREWLAYDDPCFVFFRGETTQEWTSPKTCTSKKEPLYHLHKCSTMDPDAQRNVNLLMISGAAPITMFLTSMSQIKTALVRQKAHLCLSYWIWFHTVPIVAHLMHYLRWDWLCYCFNHYVLAGAWETRI